VKLNDARTISKNNVDSWVAELLEQAAVTAPTRGHGTDVVLSEITKPADVVWDFYNTLDSPKSMVLPQTDPVVRISKSARGYETVPVYDEQPRILLNVRSCDATAISYLTKVHGHDLVDDNYFRRLESLTVISLACTTPCPEGFCVCMNAGPFAQAGADLQLTDLGESLLAQPFTAKGQALLKQARSRFDPASAADLEQQRRLEDNAKDSFGEVTCHFASAMRKVSQRKVKDELWAILGDWCLECGGCTLACPTCYCFSVKDKKEDSDWLRCRIWDSCQYAAFTVEASGHNPRAQRKDRMKRRFFHKVSAQYYLRDGMVGCVGCGRCIKVCLGLTDLPAVVRAIRRGSWDV
jgi:sulfhydrogenase subunit beta (sulfur reductase)